MDSRNKDEISNKIRQEQADEDSTDLAESSTSLMEKLFSSACSKRKSGGKTKDGIICIFYFRQNQKNHHLLSFNLMG
ncbi:MULTISPECIES: hypothetical protein [Legionella]|uniref:hypothetical protein n=1 Tax=Legionella TaxID=445 RepID=UPI0025804BA6|nr:hypothetical protein [Legionella sp. 39-23]